MTSMPSFRAFDLPSERKREDELSSEGGDCCRATGKKAHPGGDT